MFRFYSRKIDFLWLFDRERLVMAATMMPDRLMLMMETDDTGLDSHEVTERRRSYGENVISLPLGRRQCHVGLMNGRDLEGFLSQLAGRFISVVRKGMKPFAALQGSRLVPGDLVFFVEGDIVPADIRVIEADGLEVDQHILTGVSGPVTKSADLGKGVSAIVSVTALADICLAGSVVVGGKALGVVVSTGPATYLGKIIYGY